VSPGTSSGTPCVSVVVPTYCRREYLFEALESLLAQSYGEFEVIVGNDGGTDYIEPVKRRFVDDRIVWVDHPVRLGLLGNMLDGFARARGRFLATLHDDDRWDSEFLATLVAALEADDTISVAFSDHFIIDRHGHVDAARSDSNSGAWGRDRLAPGVHRPFHRMAVVDGSIPVQCAAVFRREALDLDNFPVRAGTKYDRWLVRELARGGAGAYYVPPRLAFYRSHAEQQTATGPLENARAGVYLYERFLADPELDDIPRAALRRILAGEHYAAAVALIRNGQSRSARHHLAQALALRIRPRFGLALAASLLPRAVVSRL
jgi:glycosyltransferase involved in cell wall biosynthesis